MQYPQNQDDVVCVDPIDDYVRAEWMEPRA